jgi:hypothetical protein
MDLINKLVHFRVRDVYIPEPGNLLMKLHGDDLLQGRVLDVSHDAVSTGSYAVVKVAGIDQQLIVPLDQVLGDAWMPFT